MKRIYEKPKLKITALNIKDIVTLSSLNTTLTRFNSTSFDNCIDY